MDIENMAEQAKLLSMFMNSGNENKSDKTSDGDDQIDKIIKIVKVAKMFSELNQKTDSTYHAENENSNVKENDKTEINPKVNAENKNLPSLNKNENVALFKPFEDESTALRTIKAALPFLDLKYQRNLGILVKFIEMDNLLKKYKNMTVEAQSTNVDWRRGMLNSIKQQIEPKKQKIIDFMITAMDMKDIIDDIKKEEI